MAVITVGTGSNAYEVRIGAGLLDSLAAAAADQLAAYGAARPVPVVADRAARHYHGDRLEQALAGANCTVAWHEPPTGEAGKSWAELERLCEWLLGLGVTRGDHVFALGGGVVGDLTGFACAILKRGCQFVQLPTTLLAQVDSSVGGKTAINTGSGKNLIGAFHQPALVLADTDTLATLRPRELRAGYAEVLKYGALGDPEFFAWLEDHGTEVLALEPEALRHAISHSVEMKADIVVQDERETTGTRALLNLGHTFGHALEAETDFSERLLHGEAVALGMVLAARYSARLGLLSEDDAMRLTRAVDSAGLPAEIAALGLDADGATLVGHMRHDKKMDGDTLPFILLRNIGAAFVARDVMLGDVAIFLDEQMQTH